MGKEVAKEYKVRFVTSYDEGEGQSEPTVINFTASNPEDVKAVISCISAYYSGDDCEVFINGEKAVLHLDRGLL